MIRFRLNVSKLHLTSDTPLAADASFHFHTCTVMLSCVLSTVFTQAYNDDDDNELPT